VQILKKSLLVNFYASQSLITLSLWQLLVTPAITVYPKASNNIINEMR